MAQPVREAAGVLFKFIQDNQVHDEVRFDGEKLNVYRSSHFEKLLCNLSDAFTEEILDEYPGELIEVTPDPNIERIANSVEKIERILNAKFGYTVINIGD